MGDITSEHQDWVKGPGSGFRAQAEACATATLSWSGPSDAPNTVVDDLTELRVHWIVMARASTI